MGSPNRLAGGPSPARVPALGEHTAAVLAGLGYDEDEIAALRQRGIA